jgi:hypothetical protein
MVNKGEELAIIAQWRMASYSNRKKKKEKREDLLAKKTK